MRFHFVRPSSTPTLLFAVVDEQVLKTLLSSLRQVCLRDAPGYMAVLYRSTLQIPAANQYGQVATRKLKLGFRRNTSMLN